MKRVFATPGEIALHPVALAALVVNFANDHYWKQQHPNWVTGKVSDIAGLTFFPFWFAATLELLLLLAGRRWLIRAPAMLAIIIVTASAFAAIKISHPASDVYCRVIGRAYAMARRCPECRVLVINTVDPSDLLALPALAVSLYAVRRRERLPQ